MRDIVEIGIGREARRSYRLSDIQIIPSRRTRSSKDVDTSWHIDAYTFDNPFISHPTDALATPEFIIEMGRQGGLGVINAEGLWGRQRDLGGAVGRVREAINAELSGPEFYGSEATRVLQELHAAPIDEELLTARIAEVRASGTTVAVRVTPQHARELAPVVIGAGAELLFIQGTMISAEHVATGGEPLNLKEFIGSLDVPVIAGGVADYTTALHLMRTGAAGVIVGGGANTNDVALGIGCPMATAIADAAAARRDYLDETGGRYVHIIADGEIESSGDAVTAMACGADGVILGHPLAKAREAAAQGAYWSHSAAHPRFPRGTVEPAWTDVAFSADLLGSGDGDTVDTVGNTPTLETVLHGPSTDPHGMLNYVGGLRRAMAKCGYTDLKSFQKVQLSVAGGVGF
ncbi:GuaB3 family IMP dehydrogenase-related protein [Corynebacterium pygosceleis]|uniref:GuaB3 family IMP dehydrogenase-related protein n=1 Tax=Corynebacterium pygosceleis TaxID=2800406 RepID=A0A9Q4GJF0_9CORY|nr:GuaB3 family IMP dehydrogenase-related protein [Corynebacterium pygosceleis]MCK7637592.1 GuaB3 family IMP dehydrogenase-related protein [Corynebacterium pygosceleis]MCK7674783.1 GuaB3 family IMP dehydrogenase-related protein [Corynebacterium pygosceleis]MCL0119628.1 GuaB3 family IMP dehydrogenase-related protein [Corynebacterium pygosceleis]MCX7468079.1 GuaB3 family IMP dehydrogenase-related protein [Corynebacterium pygosceleis]